MTEHNTEHYCTKESEIAELKQLIRSYSNNESKIYTNWHDIELLKKKYKDLEYKHYEMMKVLKDINNCQQDLIREAVKQNTTFNTLKWSIGIALTIFGGILSFMMIELIKLIH